MIAMFVDVLVHALNSPGYNVEPARSGFDALEIAETVEPDLLVTDIVMPGRGSTALVDRLRVLFPHLKVMFISGNA